MQQHTETNIAHVVAWQYNRLLYLTDVPSLPERTRRATEELVQLIALNQHADEEGPTNATLASLSSYLSALHLAQDESIDQLSGEKAEAYYHETWGQRISCRARL